MNLRVWDEGPCFFSGAYYALSVKSSYSLLLHQSPQVDIVVATPGRLEDMLSTGALVLSNCRFFVLDECDGLLSAGYGAMIRRLHALCPRVTPDGRRLQMIVCSATLHDFEVHKLAVSAHSL